MPDLPALLPPSATASRPLCLPASPPPGRSASRRLRISASLPPGASASRVPFNWCPSPPQTAHRDSAQEQAMGGGAPYRSKALLVTTRSTCRDRR